MSPTVSTESSGASGAPAAADGSVCIFAPVTLLTLTLERSADGSDELHVHPGGQGIWQARMVRTLGARAVVCTAVGGETGEVVAALLPEEGIELHAVTTQAANAAWIHDRREGERQPLWESEPATLGRHELDELYSRTLADAMAAGVCLLAGSHEADHVLEPELYERLASDLSASGVRVVADLSGAELEAALRGGVDVLKLSDEELRRDGWADGKSESAVLAGIERLHEAGAANVVLSRAERGSLASVEGGRVLRVLAPALEVADARGAGDSMTAALAVAAVRGDDWEEALRLAAAAGAVNVTRHGSGSGRLDTIRELARRVEIEPLERSPA